MSDLISAKLSITEVGKVTAAADATLGPSPGWQASNGVYYDADMEQLFFPSNIADAIQAAITAVGATVSASTTQG